MTKPPSPPPAQPIRPALWCLVGLAAGALLAAWAARSIHADLDAENGRLRAQIATLEKEHSFSLWRIKELDRELAVLRNEVKPVPTPKATRPAAPGAANGKPVAGPRAAHPLGPAAERLVLSDLPAAVQAALAQKVGALDVRKIDLLTEDGQWIYQVQGQTADGRRVGMRLTPDGQVLSGKSEVAAEALPAAVRGTISQNWGEANIGSAREILQKDQATYDLGGVTADGRSFSLSVAADGTVRSSETEVSRDMLPQSVQNTIAGAIGDGARAVIRQIYEDGRQTYQVGVKTETGKTRLVIGQDGTLIGHEMWITPPKPSEP